MKRDRCLLKMSRPCRVGFEGIALYPSASSHYSVVSAYSAEADSTDYFIQATVALRIAMAVALSLSVSRRRNASSSAETRSMLEKSSFHMCESLQRWGDCTVVRGLGAVSKSFNANYSVAA